MPPKVEPGKTEVKHRFQLKEIPAFLAVQLFFHQVPIEGLLVTFKKKSGEEVGHDKTDLDGVAKLPNAEFPNAKVEAGNYVCQIEHQPDTIISTVENCDDPFVRILPIGRPYFDYEKEVKFKIKKDAR